MSDQGYVSPDLVVKARHTQRLLRASYGEPALKLQRDPLSELVMTILSQNTSDTNSGRAYRSLRERYPTWDQVLEANSDELAQTIRPGGLANIKAPRIQAILRTLQDEHGELDLSFLEPMSVQEARRYLLSMPGVGPKTAACVLLFALRKPALPVDTHVHRVSLRLGLIPSKASAEKAHALLEELLPEESYYPFHLLLIQHGRTLCKAQRPVCEECPVASECEDLARRTAEAQSAEAQAATEPDLA